MTDMGSDKPQPPAPAVPESADSSPAASPKRRSRTGPAVGLVLVVVLLAAGAGAWIWWRNYVTSPQYSLGQLVKASQAKDWPGVQKYVDVDAVIGQFVDTAIGKAIQSDTSGMGALAAGLAQSMKPSLIQQAKDSWRQSVVSGSSESSTPKEGSLSDAFNSKSIKSVTLIGDQALVTVSATSTDSASYDVVLKMKRVDDFWRIVGIDNLSDLPFIKNMQTSP